MVQIQTQVPAQTQPRRPQPRAQLRISSDAVRGWGQAGRTSWKGWHPPPGQGSGPLSSSWVRPADLPAEPAQGRSSSRGQRRPSGALWEADTTVDPSSTSAPVGQTQNSLSQEVRLGWAIRGLGGLGGPGGVAGGQLLQSLSLSGRGRRPARLVTLPQLSSEGPADKQDSTSKATWRGAPSTTSITAVRWGTAPEPRAPWLLPGVFQTCPRMGLARGRCSVNLCRPPGRELGQHSQRRLRHQLSPAPLQGFPLPPTVFPRCPPRSGPTSFLRAPPWAGDR